MFDLYQFLYPSFIRRFYLFMTNAHPVVPEGYYPMPGSMGYASLIGPFYVKDLGDLRFKYGFVSDHRHMNPNNVVHGGMLNTFADHFIGHAVVHSTHRMCATISLNADYVSGGKEAHFIQGEAEVVRETRSMIFMRGTVFDDSQVILSVNGVWRLFEKFAPTPA